ncbi:MAG: ABC transporter ATP-binding protein [Alphaproteobacteria bacterium]|nr:ABC transporter ATP-binding protein [Alphaproteobacteria bacterium]
MTLLVAETLGIHFGGVQAVDDVSFAVETGRIFSIIGPNGAGKTTLFNLISGIYRPNTGRILLAGEDVTGLPPHRLAAKGIARTFQNLQVFYGMTVIENVMVGRHLREERRLVPAMLGLPSVTRQNRATRKKAHEILAFVGLDERIDEPAGALSYGDLRRLEIGRALALEPKLLLLDEPAAGCNPVETAELIGLVRNIAEQGVTIVLVEHDMRFVMQISDRVLVLDGGRMLAEGSPEAVRQNPEVVAAYLGRHGAREAGYARG